MTDLLFAVPWWLFGGLLLVGLVLLWSGNNAQQKGPLYAGIALIVLALLLKTISFFVVTDKELVTRQSDQLVKAVADRDWVTFNSLLEPDVSLGTEQGTLVANAGALGEVTKGDCERYNLTNVSGHVTDVTQDAAGITVDLDASGEMNATMGYRIPTSWKLLWQRDGKNWRLHEIICLRIGQENAQQMAKDIK
jgi:hypothetical protein